MPVFSTHSVITKQQILLNAIEMLQGDGNLLCTSIYSSRSFFILFMTLHYYSNTYIVCIFLVNMQTIRCTISHGYFVIPTSTDIFKMLRETFQLSWEVKSRSLTSLFANISPKSLPRVPASVGAFQNRILAPLPLPHTPQKAYRSPCCNVQLTLTGESTAKPTETA